MDEDWDEFYERARRLIDRILSEFMKEFRDVLESAENDEERRMVRGFVVELGPDGQPKIYELGGEDASLESSARGEDEEPIVDVYDEGDFVRVVAEAPGFSEKDIHVVAMDSKRLFLEAFKPGKRFRRVVELPTDVETNSINVSYRNGVLEIVARKK